MNDKEAHSLLTDCLQRYRVQSYDDLRKLIGHVETKEVTGPSGRKYRTEFQIFWDDRPNGNIRVMGSIDDGGLRAFVPVTHSFIKTPTGQFVGE